MDQACELKLSDGVLISGEISGRQGVTIITQNANGKVSYHANNSYTGLTNIIGGGLGGLECASPGFAFAGDLQCSSSLSFTGDQLPHNAHVTLLDGAFVTSSTTTLTMNSLDFLGGIFFNDETLDLGIILTGSDVALRMRNTTYDHPIQLTGGGSVVFDNTNDGTATITYTLDLGGNNATIFNIAKGTADIDMLISAVISNGGRVKTGPGVLSLTNANTYTAGTVVSSGELLLNAPGMNAISGDVVVKGGTVTLATPNQIPDTSTVSVSN